MKRIKLHQLKFMGYAPKSATLNRPDGMKLIVTQYAEEGTYNAHFWDGVKYHAWYKQCPLTTQAIINEFQAGGMFNDSTS